MKKILCALLGLILTLPVFAACPTGQIEQTYTSATGTVTQSGTPTPDNPIEPVFYQQGNMVLRKVGDIADSYDATTGIITRRVGVKVLDGTENWTEDSTDVYINKTYLFGYAIPKYTVVTATAWGNNPSANGFYVGTSTYYSNKGVVFDSATELKNYLSSHPVTVYYPLAEATTEYVGTEWCEGIKIATTAYNSARFSPVVTELNDTIATIRSVVTNTINQTKAIADLQATKQTRPDENCPAGKKCLLVEDDAGQPHWYEIIENAYGLPNGYTALEYIQSTGTQYIDTGFSPDANTRVDYKGQLLQYSTTVPLFGARVSTDKPGRFFPLAFSTNSGLGRFTYGNFETVFTISTSTIYTGSFIPAQQKTIINGLTYDIVAADASFTKTANNNFYLFATSGYENILYNSVGRIWYVKIYDNGTLVRDMIPAKNSSGVIGMYDTVSGTFFTNAGTGTFVEGPVVQ